MPAGGAGAGAAVARVGWFGAVGLLATAVHYGVVVLLVDSAGWQPLAANVAGWLTAFGCSFTGHYFRTFRAPGVAAHTALRRFFVVAALGFAANQAGYALLLRFTGIRYDIAVLVVALAVAVMTYLLGRHWAFRPAGEGDATRPLAVRALLALHLAGLSVLAWHGWQQPMGNWDIVPYAALVHARDAYAPEVLSRLAYRDVRLYVGESKYAGAVGGDYGGAVHRQPAALVDTLRLYEVKPLYIFLSRLVHPLTGNAASATVLVSAVALVLLFALLPLAMRDPVPALAAGWLLLLAGEPRFALLAGVATPDSLGVLLLVACALAAVRPAHWAATGGLGLLAVAARPDAAFAVVPLLAGLAWLQRGRASPWPLAGCAAASFALFVALGSRALPWSTLFFHTFVQREAFPSRIAHAFQPAEYLAVLQQTVHAVLEPRPLGFLLAGVALALWAPLRHRRIGAAQWLAAVAVMNQALHYLVFPIDEFGHERMFLGSYVLVTIAALLELERRRARTPPAAHA